MKKIRTENDGRNGDDGNGVNGLCTDESNGGAPRGQHDLENDLHGDIQLFSMDPNTGIIFHAADADVGRGAPEVPMHRDWEQWVYCLEVYVQCGRDVEQ